MVCVLSLADGDFAIRNLGSRAYKLHTGQLKKGQKVTKTSLEEEEKLLDGEEKTEFLRFIRRMLQWDPADRPSATELVNDPFLRVESEAEQEEEEEVE